MEGAKNFAFFFLQTHIPMDTPSCVVAQQATIQRRADRQTSCQPYLNVEGDNRLIEIAPTQKDRQTQHTGKRFDRSMDKDKLRID